MPEISDIINLIKKYNPTADTSPIVPAYQFALKAHTGQMRLSGEPYITHPVEIAYILAQLEMDVPSIVAALLHDVAEDTDYTIEDIESGFGTEVAELVDGVTKIAKLTYSSQEQATIDSFRKMFVAMAKDVRVVIIKLADRLHNMRTLDAMAPAKQKQKSQEVIDIYAPIAHRLGIYRIKMEFEDLALKYLDPEAYKDLEEAVARKISEREAFIKDLIYVLKNKLELAGIDSEITGRPKHYYSIYRKMQTGKSFKEIYDLTAIRVLVDSVSDCYAVLGWVHELWHPIPGRFKDYIAVPKPNNYQSLHTTVLGPSATPVEIQIRTWGMHHTAEFGIAAHYKYKEGIKGDDELAKTIRWLRDIKEIEEESIDSDDFLETVKNDLYPDEVFVFTPKGKVIDLPQNSTPVDFAYRIHTDVGNNCIGSRVNNRIVPLNYRLETGDIVEILTNPNSKGPSRDWLSFVASVSARYRIRSFFRKADRKENIVKGKSLLDKEAKLHDLDYNSIVKSEFSDFVFRRFTVSSWDELFNAIGYGAINSPTVVARIRENFRLEFAKANISEGKALLEKEARRLGLEPSSIVKPERLEFVRLRFDCSSWDELFAQIGCGSMAVNNVIARILENYPADFPQNESALSGKSFHSPKEKVILIEGQDGMAYKFAQCCMPLPGDTVIGYITRGRGITIHRSDCVNIANIVESDRLIRVEWANDVSAEERFAAEIFVKAMDRPRLLSDVSTLIGNEGINISGSSVRTLKDYSVQMSFDVVVKSISQVDKLITKISDIESVLSAYRI